MKLSVGIITFNEEKRIGRTLDSIRGLADEIIIVDSESTDRTVEIARSKGANVFVEKWKGYGAQKNSVLEKCRGEWILLLDADEVVSKKLRSRIEEIVNTKQAKNSVYEIKLRNIAFGKEIKHGGWDDYVIRLWKNGAVKISNREVHEKYETQEKVGRIEEKIIHYTYENIHQFLEKLNRYTTESAVQYVQENKKVSFLKIYSKMLFRFVKMYLLQLGFLDAYEGYLLAKYSSIYTMTKYTKLREEYYKHLGQNTTLIITTYNWKEALEQCLNSVMRQSVMPREIIIADDGSREDTRAIIESFQQSYPQVKIIHSWQEDIGFRLSMSRNRAVRKASGEYVIIIDGDLILHRDFVRDHIENMEEGCFIQGSRVIVSKEKTQEIFEGEELDLAKNIFEQGFKNKANMIKNDLLCKIFSKKDMDLGGIRGCNMSFYKKDLELVNGFEEKIVGWGREDSELAVRLFNNGIRKKKVKFNALTYHLYHRENDRSKLLENDKFLEKAIQDKKKRAEEGLDKY